MSSKSKSDKWIRLQNKYSARCVQCGEWISIGEYVLWLKGLGVKHEECDVGFREDNSALIIQGEYED